MVKQVGVNLAFNADTGKAKAQIQELQNLLNQITYSGAISGIGNKMSVDFQKASTAAKELQFHLNNAFNTTTGKFDLSLLDRSLKTSGANITQLSTQLLGAGATGQQAFLKLAQSISLADQPLLRVSNRMREFGTTMKNTIKWQISSSMIHGFMGAINSAYGYAQDLNKSLTDIRIVTGNSADEMARFAEQANKTAKALSTTTNDYAKASLIYFQQGLDDAEVQKRTDVTIKMANATGTSAQTVSDQMTAIWNNFDDGSKSLEYYADVMTALGAATASSTDEISQGLQKFAAVAETVGLSYEYATAALTAIMSNTRESADVVGTALKTLFARIQGLKLGKTLEDGVDLNKYSAALKSVGISIFESNGELKAMDNILDEMAAKWDVLNKSQQVALAQTVAGVRQYTQLIALMENWDNGDADSFQANLKTISGAEGTLDEQAEIYAQSWEAAEKRVRASAEGIYQSLLDDKFFISLNNGFANVLTGIDSFIDGLGGVKPLITGIASIFISNFAHKIPQVLDNLKYNLQILTKSTKDVYDKMASDIYKVSNTQFQAYKDTNGKSGINENSSLGVALKQANDLTAARTKLALVTDKMSESEKQMANTSLSIIQQTQDEVLALTKKKEALEKNIELQMKSAQSSAGYFNSYDLGETQAHKLENKVDINALGLQNFDGMSNLGGSIAANLSQNLFQVIDEANNKARSVGTTWEQVANTTNEKITSIKASLGTEFSTAIEDIQKKLQLVNKEDFSNVKKQLLNFLQVLPSGVRDIEAVQKVLNKLRNSENLTDLKNNFKALDDVLKTIKPNLTHSEKILSSIHGDKIHTLVGSMKDYNSTINEANSKTNILKTMLQEFQPTHVVRMSEAFGALGGMMGNVVTIGRSIKSAFDALSNPDLSGWEKFSTVLMSISMIIPGITSLMRGYATVTSFVNTTTNAYIATKAKELAIETANIAMDGVAAIAKKKNLQVLKQQNASIWAEIVAKKAGIDITVASTIVEKALGGAKKISAAEAIKKITALLAENGVEVAGNAIKTKSIVLQTILNALTGKYAGLLMLLGGGLIIGALVGLVKIFDALHTSQKEANEAIEEANKKYEEEKQKLEELENELQQVNNRIKELNSQDQLDIVDQAELDKLEARKALLESQVALQEKLAKISLGEKAEEISKNWDATTKPTDIPNENGIVKQTGYEITYPGGNPSNAASTIPVYIYQNLEEYKNSVGYDPETGRLDPNKGYSAQEEAEIIEKIEAWTAENEAQWDQWRQDNASQYEKIEANYSAMVDAIDAGAYTWKPGEKEQAQNDLAEWRKAMYGEDYDDSFIKPVLDAAENLTVQKDETTGQYTVSGLDQKTMDYYGINQGQIDSWINEKIAANPETYGKLDGMDLSKLSSDQLFLLFDNLDQLEHFEGKSIEELITYLNKIEDIKPPEFNTEEWKKDYSDKMKIINDLEETGDSISAKDYALLGEEYQKYFQVQADGTAILISKAEELKAKAQEIIKNDITGKQDKIKSIVNTVSKGTKGIIDSDEEIDTTVDMWSNSLDKGLTEEEATRRLNSRTGKAMQEALGKDLNLDQYTTDLEKLQALSNGWKDLKNSMNESQDTIASTATSIQDLDKMLADGLITQEQYNNTFEGTAIKEAQAEGLDVDAVYDYAKGIEGLIESEEHAEEMALKIAVANKKMEKGMTKLTQNWDKWSKVLKKGDKESTEYIEAMGGIKDSVSDILDLDVNQLSDSFFTSAENLALLEKAAQGDKQAIIDLRQAAAEDIVQKVTIDGSQLETDALTKVSELAAKLPDLKLGASLDSTGMTDALNEMLTTTDMSVAEMQKILNALGFDPEVEYKEVPVDQFTQSLQTGSAEVINPITGEVTTVTAENVGQFAENGKVKIPTINGSKTTYRGTGGASSVKPSGGGGGGKSKPPEKKSSTDKGRYHTIQNQLEDLKSEYEDISEAADRAFGKDKLDAIDEQIKKNEELITSQEKLLGTYGDVSLEGLDLDNFSNFENLRQNLKFDKAKMETYFKDLMGTGITFEYDEKGNISNFRQIEDYMHAQYNKNTTALKEEDWEVFEKKYEKLEEYIEQYEKTYDELRDAEQEYQDLLNKRLELELQKIQYAVELKLNISEDDMAVLEYQFDLLEDKAFASAKRITESTKQAENIYDQIQFNQQGLEETLALSGARIEDIFNGNIEGFTFTADQIDAIKEYRDNLLDLNTQLIEAQKQIEEQVIEAFNEFHDELDKGMEKFDHYNTMLESYRNIVDIVGKDVLKLDNGQIAKITSAQVDNSIRQLNAARDAYDTYRTAADDAKAKMDEYKAKVDNTNNKALKDSYQQDYEFWKQSYEEMDSSAREAQEELMDTWGSTLEAVVSQFEMAVEAAVETFNDAVYQLGGLEGLSNEFSMIKEKDDMLLDDYQKIYELSKLTRDINNSIDDTDNIGGKQKLKKLLQDINKLQEDGVEISQYDLEYLQKTYDLRLAELELEEAQRAKNTVRLSRDNEGNWSYIYTQNTDAVDAAQQKYEDALYAMQDLSSNYIDEMSEKLISTSQDMLAAISELRVEDFASQEDYYKEILRIEKMYKDQMAAQEIELNNAINNNKILYNTDWKNYSEATGYKISAAEDFATAFKDTLLGSLMDSEENTSTFTEFIGKATEQLTGELNQIAGTYYANIGNAMEAAGTKTGDFAEMLEENIAVIQSESKKAAEAVADMAEQMDNDFIDIMDNVARWQEDYGREIDKIINKNELLINSFNDMIKALSGDMNEIDIRYNISSNTEAEEATGSGEVTVPEGTVSGATGMYTGNWNSKEGRVAVLHQKELLLNENDTSNFLTAIKITRAMLETIDLNARQASFGLGNLVPSSVKDEKTQTLEQAVHITAEFPNVSDHNEIEQAFTNLINTASQYANRK